MTTKPTHKKFLGFEYAKVGYVQLFTFRGKEIFSSAGSEYCLFNKFVFGTKYNVFE